MGRLLAHAAGDRLIPDRRILGYRANGGRTEASIGPGARRGPRPAGLGPILFGVLVEEARAPKSPTTANPQTPKDLASICLKAMSKEPSQRYRSCHEMGEDLRRFQAGEPILARWAGPIERFDRWRRRNPLAAALSAAMIVLLVLGMIASRLFGVIAAEKARVAQEERLRAEESLRNERKAREQEAEARKQAEENRTKAAAATDLAEKEARFAAEQMKRAQAEETRAQEQKARAEAAATR